MQQVLKAFLEATASKSCSKSPQSLGEPQPPLELPLEMNAPLVALPAARSLNIPTADLRAVIEARRSVRRYAEQALTLEELSYLLWLTQGVQEVTSRPATTRTVPSAGARHAFETYLLVNRVSGLEAGLYRFAASQHALVHYPTPGKNIRADITHACHKQSQVANSAVTFIWAAVVERMTWRYVERGYRYLFLDAGHVCQNLYLAAESIDCGACAIASYDDDLLNQILGLDGENIFTIYLASVGKKINPRSANPNQTE